MSPHRDVAIIAGLLHLFGTLAGLLTVSPSVDSPDYLIRTAGGRREVMRAALFQFLMGAAYVAVPIVLYPVLRTHGEGLALGFLRFRIIAGAVVFVGVIIRLVLLTLSDDYVKSGTPDASHFQTLGALLRTARDLVNHVAMILAVSLGGLSFYSLLFRTDLVPRWLSGWGLAGCALAIVASLLLAYGRIGVMTRAYLALVVPLAVQELVLALWLIVSGFNLAALDTKP